MKTTLTKEKLSKWANSIADLSETLAHQITNHTIDGRDLESTLLYLKLIRHSTQTRDVSRLLLSNPVQRFSSSFILLRCMLEDFITLYYLRVNNYDRELIIRYVSEGVYNRVKMMEETAELNKRFYGGRLEGLISFDYIKDEKNRLRADPINNDLFIDKQQFKLKRFPSVRDMIKSLPVNDSTIANVPSIITWIQYSEYVHHSIISARHDSDVAVNKIQLKQMKGVMLCAYKLVDFVKERLVDRSFPVHLPFDEHFYNDLTADTIDGTDLWNKMNKE